MLLEAKIKDLFFDRQAVTSAVARAKRRNLARAGGLVKTIARRSIRRRKGVSAAGSPPSAHSRDKFATIKNILFAYQPTTESVVVGPVRLFNSRKNRSVQPTDKTVPGTLEAGGTVTVEERQFPDGQWTQTRRPLRVLQNAPRRRRTVTIAARPFMAPALEKASPRFAEQWRNSVVA